MMGAAQYQVSGYLCKQSAERSQPPGSVLADFHLENVPSSDGYFPLETKTLFYGIHILF